MIKPMGEQVVIKVDNIEKVSPGGIILVEVNPEPADSGIVIRTSITRKSALKEGDHVKFNPYAGTEFRTPDCEEGFKYRLVPEHNIYALIDDSAE